MQCSGIWCSVYRITHHYTADDSKLNTDEVIKSKLQLLGLCALTLRKRSLVWCFLFIWATVESHSGIAPSAVVVVTEGPVFLCTIPFWCSKRYGVFVCLFSISITTENECLAQSCGLVVSSFRVHDENNRFMYTFSDKDSVEKLSTFCTDTSVLPISVVRMML